MWQKNPTFKRVHTASASVVLHRLLQHLQKEAAHTRLVFQSCHPCRHPVKSTILHISVFMSPDGPFKNFLPSQSNVNPLIHAPPFPFFFHSCFLFFSKEPRSERKRLHPVFVCRSDTMWTTTGGRNVPATFQPSNTSLRCRNQ